MAELDYYPPGVKAPGVSGAQVKDWIPPDNWNVAEARPYTEGELNPPPEEPPVQEEPPVAKEQAVLTSRQAL